MRTARGPVALAALALTLTACGTTVPLSEQPTVSAGTYADPAAAGPLSGGSSAGGASLGASGSAALSGPAAASSTATSATGPSSGQVPAGAGTANITAAAGASTPKTSFPSSSTSSYYQGVTATTVTIGVVYPSNVGPEASALGISGLVTGDNQAQAKAVIDYLNQHGGLGGRRIIPVYVAIDATQNANNPDLNFQAACATLTQDHKVFAAFSIVNTPSDFLVCMRKSGVTVLDDSAGANDSTYAQARGFFYAPGDFLEERLYRAEVDALVAQGWLTRSSKIGIYSYTDAADNHVVQDAVIPELARFGLKAASTEAVDSSAQGVSQNANVVLQYRVAGVDRILDVMANPLFLMEAAQSQHYFPEFSLNSSFGPGALMETAAPPSELAGAAGIGWQPLSDLDSGHQIGPVSSNATLCTQIMNAAGQGSSSATTELFEAQICDVLFFAAAALRSQATISPASLAAGKQALANFPSAVTFKVGFPGSRPDGAAAYRDIRYESNCSCFLYTSGPQPT